MSLDDFKYIRSLPEVVLAKDYKISLDTDKARIFKEDKDLYKMLFLFLAKFNRSVKYSNIQIHFSNNAERLSSEDMFYFMNQVLENRAGDVFILGSNMEGIDLVTGGNCCTKTAYAKDNTIFINNSKLPKKKEDLYFDVEKMDEEGDEVKKIFFDLENGKFTTFYNLYTLYYLLRYVMVSDIYCSNKHEHSDYFYSGSHSEQGQWCEDGTHTIGLDNDFIGRDNLLGLKILAKNLRSNLEELAIWLFGRSISVEDYKLACENFNPNQAQYDVTHRLDRYIPFLLDEEEITESDLNKLEKSISDGQYKEEDCYYGSLKK